MSELDDRLNDEQFDITKNVEVEKIPLPDGSILVISATVEKTEMKDGSIVTYKVRQPSFDGSGTIMNSCTDVGGFCCACKKVTSKTNYLKCARCNQNFCNRCTRTYDGQTYCSNCHIKARIANFFGRKNHNGQRTEETKLLEP